MADHSDHVPVRIVLVEDSEPDVYLVQEALRQATLKFELQVLDDGEKAADFIDELDRNQAVAVPDLMLLDLNLPRKGGGEVLERVRQSPRCGGMPVVILTSSDSPKDKAKADQLKATGYFRKPSSLNEFMKLGGVVRELLEGAPGLG